MRFRTTDIRLYNSDFRLCNTAIVAITQEWNPLGYPSEIVQIQTFFKLKMWTKTGSWPILRWNAEHLISLTGDVLLTRAMCDNFTYTVCKDTQGENTKNSHNTMYNEGLFSGRRIARLYVNRNIFFPVLGM